ncbi:MAG: ATP-binding cassette domain-containing protein [Bacteroidetes bacterium]|nr:ATP-binding cassette domain-containing protein [Bacteroidota bacterium]
METGIDTKAKEKKPTPKDKETVIEIRHLKKSFGSNEVLKDINLDLYKGENVVVLGKSGEGKSVTIKCIVRLLEKDGGEIKVFGEEVGTMTDAELKALRIRIGFLFQSAALYDSMTVRDNLEFPLRKVLKLTDEAEINKRVEDVLESVGLPDAADKLPSDLSGGMRKRIGLARTLIVNPEIMLYDEPTTGLDTITSEEISELIVKLQKKYQTSSIIITHDLSCAKITSDRIVIMNDGAYIAEGTFDELRESKDENVRGFFKQP